MRFRIDLKIFLFLIVFYFTKQLEIYILMIIFAIIHELAHLVAGILLKFKPDKLELIPVGLTVSFRVNVEDFTVKVHNGNKLILKEIIIALAGPFVNILITIIAFFIDIDYTQKLLIIYLNLLIAIFNLLPIYPLDGGRILKGVLHIFCGRKKARSLIYDISIVTNIILTAIASIAILYLKNISIFIIILYLWCIVLRETIIYNKKIKLYEEVKDKLEKERTDNYSLKQ